MKCLNILWAIHTFLVKKSSLYLFLPLIELQSEPDDKVSIYPSTFHCTLKLPPSVILQVGVPLGARARTAGVWMPFKGITHK